ncbi:hypothetical protein VN12_11585 [Pirellula sp. SH-Sr6A]|uniref:glycosyltransferase family 61 protein n=1 Tax=Pirellula sp. SH-Sr6A TaxID=1632865 RepID=UPI00078B4456|nr:glycosyltransferase family 61 protein [Pirellula sp. SH-Sr6A]AMV32758.1 hypothetical protein VN12_11585 [Pirellula sp. SH-Sr6A]
MKEYDPNDFANRLIRHKKYLIPAASLMPWLPREPAPKTFATLEEACNKIVLAEAAEVPETTVKVFLDGGVHEWKVPGVLEHEQSLYVLPGGGCVGRNGCLRSSDQRAIRDTAFMGKYGVEGVKAFSRLDPRHWIHRQRGNLTARRSIPTPQRVPGSAISMNNCSCHNFFHWLTEVAPRALAAMQFGNEEAMTYIVDHRSAYQREILQLLGTKPSQWIQPHSHLHLQPDQLLWCNEPTSHLLSEFAARIQLTGRPTKSLPRKIYISRRKAAHRNLINEQEVDSQLRSEGFECYDFEALPIQSQIELISAADSIVALHGAALAHLIFASPGTQVVEIFPASRQNYDLYPRISRMRGLRHSLVLASQSKHRQQIHVRCNDLFRALQES